MSLKQAQQIGRYHIMDRIAYGGMAEIFRAKTFDADATARIVVIKKVLAHLSEDEEFIDMLVDEAKIASRLEHPNIAQIFEFGEWESAYFIAMEYVDGKDVRSILDKCRSERRRLSIENCVYIVTQGLRGLHAAHNAHGDDGALLNIVHRDVSPSNIICGYNGEIKIIDFGIAKARLSRVRTKTGVIKGKVKYMSPEQAMGKELDARSDIFSAGSVLYEMLTKVPPFQASSELDLIFRVREAEYVPPSKRNPRVPKELEKILGKAMARSRSSRYGSSAEFADDLSAFLYAIRPDYEPSEMARFLKRLYADEIERELRALEEYVVGDADAEDLGVNLIEEALPASSPWHAFRPVAEQSTVLFDTAKGRDLPTGAVGTPEERSIHERPTMIIDSAILGQSGRSIHDEPTMYIALRALPDQGLQFPVVPRGLAAAGTGSTTVEEAPKRKRKKTAGRSRKRKKGEARKSKAMPAPPEPYSVAPPAPLPPKPGSQDVDETIPAGAPHVVQALFEGSGEIAPSTTARARGPVWADEEDDLPTMIRGENPYEAGDVKSSSPPLPVVEELDLEVGPESTGVTEDRVRRQPMIHRMEDIEAERRERREQSQGAAPIRRPPGGRKMRRRNTTDAPTTPGSPPLGVDEDSVTEGDGEVLELTTGDFVLDSD